ncbi:MarR family transcriptional regulator [Arenibacter sp. GZD96]|uniref:MarR family winged helix-turn-helix transcriptional regulator n=1 Tax=Aurantibrevibacter litoralis TaxID=3106030 RepID=UPI002AFF708E|nr:MarR family transcriptional regulator [Arenibacter sp. GZD-96]MEA1786814.1 MarR family transcriptional regulator [Arenibacter sp. GZD-96]
MNVEQIIKTDKPIPLESRTIIHFKLVSNKIEELISNALKPFEVSIEQFNVLRILRGQHKQPANLSTLNERMVTKMSNTTRLVDKLLLKGYADRVVCPTNRRKVEITITDKGKKALQKMDVAVGQAEKTALAGLNFIELQQLNNLLDKF